MWAFVEVARIEQSWGRWHCLVTLERNGAQASFWIMGQSARPTTADAQAAGQTYADKLNEAEEPEAVLP